MSTTEHDLILCYRHKLMMASRLLFTKNKPEYNTKEIEKRKVILWSA